MESILQLLVIGIGMGCIYGLVAIEFTLIWNASGLINFSHDKFIMLGAYFFAGTFILRIGLPVFAALPAALLVMAVFGGLTAVGVFNPLSRMSSDIYAVMGTIMLGKILSEAVRLIWGPAPYSLPTFIKGSFHIGNITLSKVYVIIIAVTIILMILINLLFKQTRLGKAMRCVAEDKTAAALMGINVNRNIAITVGISAMLCGIISILIIPIFNVSLNIANMIGLKGFAAAAWSADSAQYPEQSSEVC